MEKIDIKVSARQTKGKSACKHLRRDGFVPGIVYKGGEKSLPIYIDSKDLWHALHTEAGENAIITLNIADGKKKSEKTVIVRETQTDPVKDELLHVDFYEISLTEEIKVKVPVNVKGEAVGVKEDEGVLNQVLWELEVECKAMAIPENIEIHVDELRIGNAIHVKDIAPPQGVRILDDPEQVIVGVNPPHVEEVEEAPAEEALGEEAAEPEVIKKGKKEEEEIPEEEAAAKEEKEEKPSGKEKV